MKEGKNSDKEVIILGIESSCDDTSAAVIRNETILSNVVANQKIHEEYGGVGPELASRAHQQNIIPVVDRALKRAGVGAEQAVAALAGECLQARQRVRVQLRLVGDPDHAVFQRVDGVLVGDGGGVHPAVLPGGAVRPARPERWSAEARLIRSTKSMFTPRPGS